MDMMMGLCDRRKIGAFEEKMKKKLEAVKGKKLDKVADLFVDAMMEEYKDKAGAEKRKEELREKFEAIMSDTNN